MPALGLLDSYNLVKKAACRTETGRDAVVVRGPDARSWLQGQVSQDLAGLGPGGSAETLLLSPQGKVESYCRATIITDDVVLLDTDTGFGEALSERLRRFRLRVKAELEPGTIRRVSVRGPEADSALFTSGLEIGKLVPGGGDFSLDGRWAVAVSVDWPGFAGFDVLLSNVTPGPELEVPLGDAAGFEAARIEAGVPAIGRELTDKTIPQEAGALVEHAVSFTKGCYTGQELVARLDARGGNVARRLRGVVLASGSKAEQASVLLVEEREVGYLTSVSFSPGYNSPVALGYVRRDVLPPFEATAAPDYSVATIRELPL